MGVCQTLFISIIFRLRFSISEVLETLYGPFKIIEAIGLVAYRLALPDFAKIHPVFHCSLLKPHCGPHPPPQELPPMFSDDIFVPHWRLVLVQWHGLPPEDTTWESWDLLSAHYHHDPISTEVVIDTKDEPNVTNGPKNDDRIGPKHITKRPSNWDDYEH